MRRNRVDLLCISAHPDDAEWGCGGTLRLHVLKGHRVGMVDLSKGERGTRGSPEVREEEAQQAMRVLGALFRENMGFSDAFLGSLSEQEKLSLVDVIRKYEPRVVITNPPEDRHPDHGDSFHEVQRACFLAGLSKIQTNYPPYRPQALYSYMQTTYLKPDLLVDISPVWEDKMKLLRCFKSQFHNPKSQEPHTFISSPEFFPFVEARAREMGRWAEVKYAEGFLSYKPIIVPNLLSISVKDDS
ncbi:MAG: bacillithiol biosynthesis deacetylase BshB1 [Cytophagales bacterium]|nr:bacillithiol biosynthesis deacetylase BshB1 [Cytophagales bacterium]